MVEGMAKCINNEGLAIPEGCVAYIREIPNMPGHCIVLRDGEAPLVGYHLDRFQLLKEDDHW